MKLNMKRISAYVDAVFCLVLLPLMIAIIPLDKMFANAALFTAILVVFLYSVYFLYRKLSVPSLFMKKKFFQAFVFIGGLLATTAFLAHFPLTDDFIARLSENDVQRVRATRSQRVWFLFLTVSGFSLSIELALELLKQESVRKELEEAKNKAEKLVKAMRGPNVGMVITVKEDYFNVPVPVSDIIYIEAMNNYCRIFRTGNLVTRTRCTLKSLIEMLPPEGFVRIHRSFVVAADKVASFTRKEVLLSGGKALPVGRQYADAL